MINIHGHLCNTKVSTAIIFLNKKRFSCEVCGVTVFTEYDELIYKCNGCGTYYKGEAKNGQ